MMAEDEESTAEVECKCSRPSVFITWWWILAGVGMIWYYWEVHPPAESLGFWMRAVRAAVIYFTWPFLACLEAAQLVLLLQDIAMALGVGV
jgi:hypothetical protein